MSGDGNSGGGGSTTSQTEQANGKKQGAKLYDKLYNAYLSFRTLCLPFDIISIEWDVIMSLSSKIPPSPFPTAY